jgi:hypothetical protein
MFTMEQWKIIVLILIAVGIWLIWLWGIDVVG